MAWKDRDPEEFWKWYGRMIQVDFQEMHNEIYKRSSHVPRHRLNTKQPNMP